MSYPGLNLVYASSDLVEYIKRHSYLFITELWTDNYRN